MFFFYLLALLCVSGVYTNKVDEEYLLKNYYELEESFYRWLEIKSIPAASYLKQYPPYSYQSSWWDYYQNLSAISEDISISKCLKDIIYTISNVKSDWALQMLDSDGKLSSGLLQGNLLWTGKYEECANVYAPINLANQGNFHGQYCASSWSLKLPGRESSLPLTVGVCIPDSCSAQEFQYLQEFILTVTGKAPVLNQIRQFVNLTSVTCKGEQNPLDGAAIAYISVVSIFGVLMLFGSLITLFDHFKSKEDQSLLNNTSPAVDMEYPPLQKERTKSSTSIEEKTSEKAQAADVPNINDESLMADGLEKGIMLNRKTTSSGFMVLKKIFLCFCVFTNGSKILNTDARSDQMLSINGIRFLSLTWVIMGHSYISAVAMISNPLDVIHKMDNFPFQAALQSPFSVDSFFLLSGFLLSYLFLKEARLKKGKMNWVYFYVHRYWRLTPAYLLSVGFYMVVFKYLGSGPFWDEHYGDSCRHTWWWYVLYINNFIPVHDMCIGWSWYLANDMQFYIISPIFLYALWRWPKVGLGIVSSLMVGSWITTGIMSTNYDLIPMFVGVTKATNYIAYEEKMWHSFDLIYDKPYCRIAPYLIGVILGYILFQVKGKKNFLKMWQQILGWIIALFCSLSVVYGLFHVELSTLSGNVYNAMCRSSFSIGLAWVIFVCNTGHGGPVDKILSLKLWIPLSRLTYCAYLFHPILIHGYYQSLQAPLYFTQLTMVTNFLGFLVMSYAIAFGTSIAFESPMMNLEKLLINSFKKQK